MNLEPFRELVGQYRKRAERAANMGRQAQLDSKALSPSDARFAPTVARHATLSTAADIWNTAADDLEKLLSKSESPSKGGTEE